MSPLCFWLDRGKDYFSAFFASSFTASVFHDDRWLWNRCFLLYCQEFQYPSTAMPSCQIKGRWKFNNEPSHPIPNKSAWKDGHKVDWSKTVRSIACGTDLRIFTVGNEQVLHELIVTLIAIPPKNRLLSCLCIHNWVVWLRDTRILSTSGLKAN